MIKLFVFDMGGVVCEKTDFDKKLANYLGVEGRIFRDDKEVEKAIWSHMEGRIDENQFWKVFSEVNGSFVESDNSLLGKFFNPYFNEGTIKLIQDLKAKGNRVVCGTNVVDAHYKIHMLKGQYDIFDKVYPSHLIHVSKPNIDFYRYICEKEKIDACDVFFTDDREENIITAKKYGLNAEVFENANQIRNYLKINNIFD